MEMKLVVAALFTLFLLVACSGDNHGHYGDAAKEK